ncbi:MAG: hypothetical protein RIR51_1786, partial [Bacteroidota bacterium]
IQNDLKSKGLPWEIAKAFDNSALIGNFIPFNYSEYLQGIEFTLEKNNTLVQKGNSKEMIWGIEEIIAYISRYFTLKTGDILFSGTPSGVGKIAINDTLIGKIEEKEFFNLKIK